MKPVSPVIPGIELPETPIAEHQDEYETLPAFRFGDQEGTVLSRWHLSWLERLRVLLTGDVYLFTMTFNRPLQPVLLQVEKPAMSGQQKGLPG